jgi:hypothetical protein
MIYDCPPIVSAEIIYVHTGLSIAYHYQNSLNVWVHNKDIQETG